MIKNIVLLITLNSCLFCQNFSGGFNFFLPPQDTISTSFLPKFPVKKINDQDFVSVNSDGNFCVNNTPLKFWGTNCVFGAAFPDKTKAWFIAGRLRKMGFNLIRFHHMDNSGSESLFDQGQDTRHLNLTVLDRLENYLAELKKNGIYADINLHVSRTFKTSDGVANADSIVDYGKGVTIFDQQLIDLQKEYASQLLTHVNPYTGLSLVKDPVMAMVEITNENSLYRMWRDGKLKSFSQNGSLIMRHVKMLDSLWNKYLSDKYTSTANLTKAWNEGTTQSSSNNLVVNGDFETGSISSNWIMELHDIASAVMMRDTANHYAGSASAKITVTNVTATDWHIQWKQSTISVKKDSLYTVEFAARADTICTVNITVMRDNDPYTGYGDKSFQIDSKWGVYSFSFKVPEDNLGKTRLSFSFNNRKGNYWFDNIKIYNTGVKGILAGESIESGTVNRTDYFDCRVYSKQRVKDISAFYIKLQDDYYSDMMQYLKKTLGVKVPITGTNLNVGPGDLITQSKLDYIDNHSYWDHPGFPNIPWSSTDWNITNQPMVKSASGGIIPYLFAGIPFKGKPFTVSEYNHAYPNIYQTEAMLFTTAYCSFNDADAIMFFDYNGSNDWETDRVSQYFDIHRNTAYMSLVPSCAFAFRNGLIAKAKDVIYINYNRDYVEQIPQTNAGVWSSTVPYPANLALKYAIKNASFESSVITDFSSLPQSPVNPFVTTSNEITYNTDGLLTAGTKNFAAAAGFLNNFPNAQAANMQIKSASGFGVITWISLSGDSLASAAASLITLSSRVQNSGMVWDGITTVHSNWGIAPTIIEPLKVLLKLKIYADSIKIYPLDTKGLENSSNYSLYYPSSPNNFDVIIDQGGAKSMWYGIEKFGKGSAVSNIDKLPASITRFSLLQNSPNPFNPSTTISYSLPKQAAVLLKVYDMLGKEVATLVNKELPAGSYNVLFDASKLGSGVYFYTIKTDGYFEAKKMLLLK